ncbi:unnamed protein product [Soboliphyme baturini]|uniref:Autophagy protein 5 n=1 Tax=Soboliphyme baturini TaxID=241478 RepID=A0A183J6I0_9BILA|nr:unnamed protein product [Soboliphyme baturini]
MLSCCGCGKTPADGLRPEFLAVARDCIADIKTFRLDFDGPTRTWLQVPVSEPWSFRILHYFNFPNAASFFHPECQIGFLPDGWAKVTRQTTLSTVEQIGAAVRSSVSDKCRSPVCFIPQLLVLGNQPLIARTKRPAAPTPTWSGADVRRRDVSDGHAVTGRPTGPTLVPRFLTRRTDRRRQPLTSTHFRLSYQLLIALAKCLHGDTCLARLRPALAAGRPANALPAVPHLVVHFHGSPTDQPHVTYEHTHKHVSPARKKRPLCFIADSQC